ncbi:(2Fe-2S)-binding protein [Actinomadura gamaensis]|uniref:Bacterioferritin-associated ferredoxin n=1 Tax=Actinomadura gamaensis TaxID=1763541 RepID=A0ABV9U4Q6_9ACTN
MYVCVCNAVTEDDVRGCMLDGGCRQVREVKDACGWKPGCGSCTRRLYALVSEVNTASDMVDAITGGPVPPVLPAGEPAPPFGVPAEPRTRRLPIEPVNASAPAHVSAEPARGAAEPARGAADEGSQCPAAGSPACERAMAPVRSRWLRDTAA